MDTSMTLIDLFNEYFSGWRNDVARWREIDPLAIEVTMKNGRIYEFGAKGNGEVYLRTVKDPNASQK